MEYDAGVKPSVEKLEEKNYTRKNSGRPPPFGVKISMTSSQLVDKLWLGTRAQRAGGDSTARRHVTILKKGPDTTTYRTTCQ
ncbi:hypothetical protein NSK_001800 [Nannochloropsis salina CCMP1776]|uniref:Uncharacterized protein n=1 Tax=Nannochloropsis salina CCMP1776 TaxID=1027361 RepID=A0A4D9D570_9STRA|nr:hypothetical protein NSK_001800 [Nannochloropsis salina CCMP1776]|eukprot:TFJ86712.1 hypothetical protein NSK_001800 [Nannochloropsis salina CCMP1776]